MIFRFNSVLRRPWRFVPGESHLLEHDNTLAFHEYLGGWFFQFPPTQKFP